MSRDPSGIVAYRAWLYSTDETGRAIRAPGPGERRIKAGSSPPFYGPSPEPDEATLDELIARAQLTPDELAVTELRRKRYMREVLGPKNKPVEIPITELSRALEEGWDLVRQENGRAVITIRSAARYTHDEMAEMLGMDKRQLRALIESANRKIRGAR